MSSAALHDIASKIKMIEVGRAFWALLTSLQLVVGYQRGTPLMQIKLLDDHNGLIKLKVRKSF